MKRAVKFGSEGGGWDRLGECGKVTHPMIRAPMESLVQGTLNEAPSLNKSP